MAAGEKIIGIDLGTTNSVVAVMEGREAKVIPNAEGNRLTPSVVAFTDKGDVLVGEPARRQAVTNPKRTVFSIKRFMGRRHSEVATEEKMVPYEVVGGTEDYVKVKAGDKQYTPPEISALILRKLKEAAEAYLGHKVNKAVITVPAYFNDAQRQATKDAGQIAGLEVARIINEPTAASLAYGLDKKGEETICVFDLGGGTFDVSVLEVADGVFRVISTNGDTHLGGDDFDEVLIHHVADQFKRDQGIDLRKDHMALQRLTEACEKAKKELSSAQTTDINLPFITADASGPKHLQMTITRAEFEKMVDQLIDRVKGPVQQALKDAKLDPSKIDEVVLVGGSTRIPKVQQVVKELFGGKEPHKGVNPDEVVAVWGGGKGGGVAGGGEGIPPAPRGVPQIEVKFDIDANGILNVAAKDLGTGTEQTVRIEQSSGLSDTEIEKMRRDAESHADDDKKKRALAEARNEGESRAYQLEKLIKQQGDKLKDTDKQALENAIAKVREAAKSDDVNRIKGAISELEAASHAMSEALYKTAAGGGAGPQVGGPQSGGTDGAATGAGDEDVVDAEFEVKK